jgi:hypothetical protein
MAAINVNSISGINSITAQGSSITVYNSNQTGIGTLIAYLDTSLTGFTTTSFATKEQVSGITTTGITTSGNNRVTITGTGQVANISNGDLVTGTGITPGTFVTAGGGTSGLTLSANAGFTSTTSPFNPLTFYNNTEPLSAGSVGGQLCRAWINFNGTLPAVGMIRSSYNVSSITDNNVGDYTINLIQSMPDINYSYVLDGRVQSAGSSFYGYETWAVDATTTFLRVRFATNSNGGTGTADSSAYRILVFR